VWATSAEGKRIVIRLTRQSREGSERGDALIIPFILTEEKKKGEGEGEGFRRAPKVTKKEKIKISAT